MKTRSFALATVLVLAPASVARVSTAQTHGDDDVTNMARARFKEGVGFFDKGEYEKARAAFLQAYARKKHPSVLLNLAWSCVKGTHALEGEKYFQQLTAEGGKDLTDKQRADATDGLTQARAKLGRIEVTAPPGTDVMLDGEHAGEAPIETLWVEPGAHTVKMRGGDGGLTVTSVSVLAGERAVARFAKTAAAAVAPPATGPSPPPEATAPPPEAPPPKEPEAPSKVGETPSPPAPPPPAEHEEPAPSRSPGLFSPPNNVVPVVVFGGVAVAGFVGAGIAAVVKGQAQNSANKVAQLIVQKGGKPSTCVKPTTYFQPACSELTMDDNDVNQDATVGNVLLGVGVAGVVGGLAYWMFADKTRVHVTTSVNPSFRGLVMSGEF